MCPLQSANFLNLENGPLEFCPIESVKAIFGKFCQIWADLGSLKCDPYVKHLFLWLFIEIQHKLCKRYLN